jgi:ribosomal subunit interface protein
LLARAFFSECRAFFYGKVLVRPGEKRAGEPERNTMNVIVQSKTLVVTEAIRSFVRRQLRRLNHRGAKIAKVTVFLENVKKKKNDVHSASAKILIDLPGKNILVQERAQDLYFAIGEAARAATRRLSDIKGRRLGRTGRLAFVRADVQRTRR